MSKRCPFILVALLSSVPVCGMAGEFRDTLQPFLARYCHDCHGDGAAEGGLDFSTLKDDLADEAAMATWIRIHDRVKNGEMPPEEGEQPSDEVRRKFANLLAAPLTKAHADHKGTVLRRLNRREYQNTLNDLFGTNLDLATELPEDGRSHEFDNVGESLNISMVQLQQYLAAIDKVIDTATAKTIDKPLSNTVRASYADTRGGEKFLGDKWLKLPDGAVVFYQAWGYPTGMLREANVRTPGWYKIRVTGYAHQSDRPITFALGATTFARGLERPTFGHYSLPPKSANGGKPTTVEITVWIEANYMIEVTPQGIYDSEYKIKNDGIQAYRGPGLAVSHIEVEGPLHDAFPSLGHRLLFTDLDRSEIEPRNPRDKQKSWYKPKFEIRSDDPAADARKVLHRVATAAFRRPVREDELTPYVQLFQSHRDGGASFEEALRTAAAAIFCSSDFLYLVEESGRLGDHALAARLSYFLTRTAPDTQLRRLADTGDLAGSPQVLRQQVERLLRHQHHERFVVDFTDAWLNLRDIEFTSPDRQLFPEYDPYLQASLLDESRGYFRELIDEDLSVTHLVQSDFAMLNERTALHYGIAGVDGPEVRRVKLSEGSVRGGFLSQGAVLKVSANGTNTSPVVRGVWVNERILGQTPPPPPPGVPGVEPDIRGAETLRELLAKHRDSPNCQSCHTMIDPPGFAMESFNPIGGWRDRYRSLGEGERVDTEVRGNKVRYKLGQPVDATGQLADGRKFADFNEFRDELCKDKDALTRAFATKLLTFATGREMGFSDREEIERITAASAKQGHGVRGLIHLVVQSEIFQSK